MKLTSKQVKDYMSYRSDQELIHCPDCIAAVCNDMAQEFDHIEFVNIKPLDFMRLLFFNDSLNDKGVLTHNYGFHTATGRRVIETLKEKYYEYKNEK